MAEASSNFINAGVLFLRVWTFGIARRTNDGKERLEEGKEENTERKTSLLKTGIKDTGCMNLFAPLKALPADEEGVRLESRAAALSASQSGVHFVDIAVQSGILCVTLCSAGGSFTLACIKQLKFGRLNLVSHDSFARSATTQARKDVGTPAILLLANLQPP